MRGVNYYYTEFQRILDKFDINIGNKLRVMIQTERPQEVCLWLYDQRNDGKLTPEIDELLASFYDELR